MMRDAALRDFSQILGLEVLVTCDHRLKVPANAQQVVMVDLDQDVWALWEACIAGVDGVLLIAPETDGVLEKLTALAERLGKTVLGSSASAIKLAGDKWSSFESFISHDIPTLPTYLAKSLPNSMTGAYVVKPRDGAGCDGMAYFDDLTLLRSWIERREDTHIVQTYQKGVAASFSMLCREGKGYLLSANIQRIRILGQCISYHGGITNGMAQYASEFTVLAKKIAQSMPGLAGYVGVDLIVDAEQCFVLEVNPRLTTSYVTLHEACGSNPAQMLLDLFYNETFVMPAINHHKVEFSLDSSASLTN